MRVLRVATVGLVCALLASPAVAQRDHYMCYATKAGGQGPIYGKTVETAKLYAAFDDILSPLNPQGLLANSVPGVDTTVQMKKQKEFCLPTDKNDEGLTDPATGYVMYQISPQKGQCAGDPAIPCGGDDDCGVSGPCAPLSGFDKKAAQNTGVRVVDQFSDLRLDFGKQVAALVPATFDGSAFGGVPAGEEHYKCYSIKPAKASCVGGTNDGETCKDSSTCGGGGTCTANPKFPKDTHPEGISATIENGAGLAASEASDPEKAVALSKLKMFCQAADMKLAGQAVEARTEEQAGLLCYAAKGTKAACDGGTNNNATCGDDADCPGGTCRPEPAFNKDDPAVLGTYIEDQLFQHRLNIAKEDMLCVPACRGYEDFVFTDQLLHVTNAALGDGGGPLTGLPNGVDLDGDNNVDNMIFQTLGLVLGDVLQDEIDGGGINILFQASALADGPITVTGFLGDLDTPTGCTTGPGTPGNPVDPANPSTPCNYILDSDGLSQNLTTSCKEEGLITLNVDVAGATTPPTATAEGGGPGSNFTLSLSLGGVDLELTAVNVVVDADLTHDGTNISQILGVLGGGVSKAALVNAVAGLPSQCFGGANDGTGCTLADDSECSGGGDCAIFEGLVGGPITANTGPELAVFIEEQVPADLDLDPSSSWPGDVKLCPDCDSVSLGLQFRGTRAIRTGVTSIDN